MFGAVNALFSGFALAGVIYAILLQRKELSLQRRELELNRQELSRSAEAQERGQNLAQVKFLIDLTADFLESKQKYSQAWQTLSYYSETPREMPTKEWEEVGQALELCYESTLFIHQIARLTEKGIIDPETLYFLHYEKITDHPSHKLSFLKRWCGTGVDLAANYDVHDVILMAKSIGKLLQTMNEFHLKHGGDIYEHQLNSLESLVEELVVDPNRYVVSSDTYINNYISLTD